MFYRPNIIKAHCSNSGNLHSWGMPDYTILLWNKLLIDRNANKGAG